MPAYYFDTSALIKRYVQEQGRIWITGLTQSGAGNVIYTASLTGPEIVATFFRKARGGQISRAEANRIANDFHIDWQQGYEVLDVSPAVISGAMQLAEKYFLRGADAIHLASALELHKRRANAQLPQVTFVSADIEQLQAAQAEGLPTENPDSYT